MLCKELKSGSLYYIPEDLVKRLYNTGTAGTITINGGIGANCGAGGNIVIVTGTVTNTSPMLNSSVPIVNNNKTISMFLKCHESWDIYEQKYKHNLYDFLIGKDIHTLYAEDIKHITNI